MRSLIFLVSALIIGSYVWFTFKLGGHEVSTSPDLTGMSSDPHSPQKTEAPRAEVDPSGPAPELFKVKRTKSTETSRSSTSTKQQKTPVKDKSSEELEVTPEAFEYYRKRGLLGAPQAAVAILSNQPEIWQQVEGSNGLGFRQAVGGLTLTFETSDEGLINGAVVNLEGQGGGAQLMTVEMWMTGMEHPWELYWETERPGYLAGQVPTPDGQELHYFCDMVSVGDDGALNEPSRCHFLLNQPTPEELAYQETDGALPLMKARSRIEP